jgi:hypothetical protein
LSRPVALFVLRKWAEPVDECVADEVRAQDGDRLAPASSKASRREAGSSLALQQAAQLDGCYVAETDLKTSQADADLIHDRYKDLALVERDFHTFKTGHLDFCPWFVCSEDNIRAHTLTSMLALKVRRHLERGYGGSWK